MGIREVLRKSDIIVNFYNEYRKIKSYLRRKSTIQQYLRNHSVRKLQIGSGFNHIPSWLVTDITTNSDYIEYLDATKPFPIPEGTFDYIFSEHMIEHISWQKGQLMLRECRRVLKPGGIIRIATPDLAVLIGLYQANRDAQANRYIEWVTDRFLQDIEEYKAPFVINNAFRNWGHQFLYDGEVLKMAMSQAGFVDIVPCVLGVSAHVDLQNIEMHGAALGEAEIIEYETMVFEGARPE